MIKNTAVARTIFAAIGAFVAITLPAVATAEPTEIFGEPSSVEKFGDWVAGCAGDEGNKWHCTGVALIPENSTDPKATVMRLDRWREYYASISFPLIEYPAGDYLIKVDGRQMYRGDGNEYSSDKTISAGRYGKEKSYDRLSRQIARGKRLTIHNGQGDLLGTVSLTGSTASMRYSDREQGRAGYKNAYFNRGPGETNPRRRRAESATYPTADQLPSLEVISNLLADDSCRSGIPIMGSDHEIHPFPYEVTRRKGGGTTTSKTKRVLVFVDCGKSKAGQISRVYIATQNEGSSEWGIAPARSKPDYRSDETFELPMLNSPTYERNKHTITLKGTRKIQGQADCGIRQEFTYYPSSSFFGGGARYEMPVCGGDTEWIRVE